MKVLQLTSHFRPNIGGVETHLDDLVNALIKRHFLVTVLTYRPLTTQAEWKIYESSNNLSIIRIPWLPNLFYSLISLPILEFLYLLPGLFIVTPFVLLVKNPDIIHAHGLVAGFVGVFWGNIFRKRVIISTHSIYNFPKRGIYKNFATWIFKTADYCLGLSKQSADEILSLGISKLKVNNFTYWIDLDKFKVQSSKFKVKKILGWDNEFVILFVGRLVFEKGLEVLLESVKSWDKGISLKIIGSGPLERNIKNIKYNVKYLGKIDNEKLPLYYSAADVLIVPSVSEEGFGRVILESLSCGTPVLASNRGAIPEAIDKTVGRFIDISPKSIKNAVEYFYIHRDQLKKLAKNCRSFAERRYSEKNVEAIINVYK